MNVPEKNWFEWSVFAGSLALILAVAGSLVYSHLHDEQRPASLRVVAGEPVRTATGFAVPLDIHNEGDVTAESVQLEIVLTSRDAVERSRVEVAAVPRQSRRQAWAVFAADPAGGTLSIRAVGYEDP